MTTASTVDARGAAGQPARRRASGLLRGDKRELALIAVTILTLGLVGIFNHDFLSLQNLRFMVLNCVVLSLVSLGQTMVIATRGIDLSVAPVLGLTAMVTGLMASTGGLPLAGACAITLAIGLVLGTLNGLLVALLAIPPIITTLGTYSLYSGLVFIYSNGTQVTSVPPSYATFGNGVLSPLFPVPIPVLLLAALLALTAFTVSHTRFGRAILAIGNNQAAAYNAGIAVTSVQVRAYTISGVLASIAGLMFVSYTGSATAPTGTGGHRERQTTAGARSGGTAIAGGRASMVGTVLGALFLSVVLTALVFVHVPPIWYSAGEGLMILAAVTAGFRGAERSR